MAKMKIGRTTSQTTPPDYKKYQADSIKFERLNKEFKELPNKNKFLGEDRFGKLRKLNPEDQKKVYALQDRFAPNQLKDSITHVGSYETDAQFMKRFTNMTDYTSPDYTTGTGRPGSILKKPVKPKQVIDPSKTKKSVTAEVVAVTPKETIAKTTTKEDMTPPSRMAIKKPGLIKTATQSLQGEYSPKEAPEYIQPGYRRENRQGGLSPTLAAKVVQKLTGYNKDYMEGKNGNFGEIDRSKGWDTSTSTKTGRPTETPRRTEFQGASSLKDIKAQKKYNKAYNSYASSIDNPANRNTVTSQLLKLGEFLKR
jgi:hypothetical protein